MDRIIPKSQIGIWIIPETPTITDKAIRFDTEVRQIS
jgi:hypothetical protein